MEEWKKNKHLDWFNSEIGATTIYHNHKENMSWVATALAIPGFIGLGIYILNNDNTELNYLKWVLFGVTALLAITVMAFVYKQFELRKTAAETDKAFRKLIQNVLENDNSIENWDHTMSQEASKPYPKFVTDAIGEMKGKARPKFTWVCTDLVCCLGIALASAFACVAISLT